MRKSLRIFLFLSVFGIVKFGFAQVNDAQAWLNIELEKKITQAFSAGFTQEVRLNENISEVGTIYSDIGVGYRFSQRFKAGISYRFTLKRRLDDTYEKRHSWYAEGSYREKFKPVELALRLRYQSRYDEANTNENAGNAENHLRTKLNVNFDLDRKYAPYLFGEAFFRLGYSPYQSFDELRFGGGVEYSFNRRNKLNLSYFISKEIGVNDPQTAYVIGAGYYFLLP